jgi:hypothetical protein
MLFMNNFNYLFCLINKIDPLYISNSVKFHGVSKNFIYFFRFTFNNIKKLTIRINYLKSL